MRFLFRSSPLFDACSEVICSNVSHSSTILCLCVLTVILLSRVFRGLVRKWCERIIWEFCFCNARISVSSRASFEPHPTNMCMLPCVLSCCYLFLCYFFFFFRVRPCSLFLYWRTWSCIARSVARISSSFPKAPAPIGWENVKDGSTICPCSDSMAIKKSVMLWSRKFPNMMWRLQPMKWWYEKKDSLRNKNGNMSSLMRRTELRYRKEKNYNVHNSQTITIDQQSYPRTHLSRLLTLLFVAYFVICVVCFWGENRTRTVCLHKSYAPSIVSIVSSSPVPPSKQLAWAVGSFKLPRSAIVFFLTGLRHVVRFHRAVTKTRDCESFTSTPSTLPLTSFKKWCREATAS